MTFYLDCLRRKTFFYHERDRSPSNFFFALRLLQILNRLCSLHTSGRNSLLVRLILFIQSALRWRGTTTVEAGFLKNKDT